MEYTDYICTYCRYYARSEEKIKYIWLWMDIKIPKNVLFFAEFRFGKIKQTCLLVYGKQFPSTWKDLSSLTNFLCGA